MELNYGSYLKLQQLLDLQQPRSEPAEHDELLFIIIHQVYELWFKQILHEVDRLKTHFSDNRLFNAVSTLKRVRMILKTLVGQLDVLETMSPLSFSAFRDRLDSASGFQSMQFRELEFVLGYKRAEMLRHFDKSWPGYEKMLQRLEQPSVVQHFYDFLEHHGVTVAPDLRRPSPPQPTRPDATVQRGILEMYKRSPEAKILFEMMTDVDEGLQEWRYRHVKLIERTIGNKKGTGGSLGVEFLKQTLFRPIFPDLWAIRHEM